MSITVWGIIRGIMRITVRATFRRMVNYSYRYGENHS